MFEEQLSPIRVEGESSQENLPDQEADQEQVDPSVTHGETLTTASTERTEFSSCVADFGVV